MLHKLYVQEFFKVITRSSLPHFSGVSAFSGIFVALFFLYAAWLLLNTKLLREVASTLPHPPHPSYPTTIARNYLAITYCTLNSLWLLRQLDPHLLTSIVLKIMVA